ncbi:MAG TPA: neutral zinc metallopeptidase [Kribbellaceae bacterium]|jgi:hypothetical protein
MTNHPRSTQRSRRWSLTKRAVVAVLAITSCAVAAAPGAAQAAPTPPQPTTAKTYTVAAESQTPSSNLAAGTTAATTTTSSWYNTVRYNRIYKYGGPIGVSRCHEPTYPLNSLTNIQYYSKRFLSCLNTAWSGNVKKAGFTFTIPHLIFYQSTYQSHCGTVSGNAFYCSYGNGEILIPWTLWRSYWYNRGQLWTRAWVAQTMAHEYGHHIQDITGILDASWNRQWYTFKTTADKLEESRRRELQATCWGGGYLGADRAYFPMTGSLYTMWKQEVYSMGDQPGSTAPRDHGSPANNGFWATRGFNYHTSGSCITWAVSDAMVS